MYVFTSKCTKMRLATGLRGFAQSLQRSHRIPSWTTGEGDKEDGREELKGERMES